MGLHPLFLVATLLFCLTVLSCKVTVVGGGVGGLFSSALLQKLGHEVTILEKNDRCGGRMTSEVSKGYRFDVGPSLLLMPDVYRDAFAQLGENIDDHVNLLEVQDVLYRVFFSDAPSTNIDISRTSSMRDAFDKLDPGQGDFLTSRYEEYLKISTQFLQFGWPAVIEERFFENINLLPNFLAACLKCFPLVSHTSMLRRLFGSGPKREKVSKLLSFQNLYIGLAPSETPAIFSLLQALEFVNGIYYPEGGFQSVTNALVSIATARGVKILTSNPVSSLVIEGNKKIVSGCETKAGFVPSDATIVNIDAPEAEARLLPDDKNRDARTLSCRPSCGIVQLSFGLKRRLSSLAHHNLFLSVEPEEVVWESILNPDSSKVFNPKAFNFYVHAPARTDPSCCPADHDAITVLVPVTPLPNGHTLKDQDDLVATVREHVLKRLGDSCGEIRKHDIACEMNRSPITWHKEFGLFRGQAFGLAHNLGQLSVLRPAIQHPKIDNLFRVGASTRPGNGVPLTLVSGRLAAETAQRHFQTRIKQQ